MKLDKGINFGGYLSQCVHTLEHYEEFISEEDVKRVADWGFDHIRLPIDAEVYETEDGQIFEEGVKYVDQMVDWCEKYGLNIILDLHKAYGYDFNDTGIEGKNNLFSNEELKLRFTGLWSWIATRYGTKSHVALELLNEVVEEENAAAWNELIGRALAEIRKVAPTAPVIYGGIQWNSARTLKLLDIPQDENVIFTFHMYEPLIFTHQKAYWVPGMPDDLEIIYPGSVDYYKEKSALIGDKGKDVTEVDFDEMGVPYLEHMAEEAIVAAKNAGVKLYVGEFGVIDQAPVQDTKRWFADIMQVFHKYDIGFALWSYKKMDFGILDEHYDEIREELLDVLTK